MERKQTFIIGYYVFLPSGKEHHKTKVKNCMSELHAKIKIGEYAKKKYGCKIEIDSCEEDFLSVLGNIFGF